MGGPPVTSVKPLVHGYIRMELPNETEIESMRKDIGLCCTLHSYRSGSVYIDRGAPDDVYSRTRFFDLLSEVREMQAHAVVVPTAGHLSSDASVRNALERMIEHVNAKVLVVYETNGGGPSFEGGRDVGLISGG